MSLDLDARQRAMLAEMGVTVWAPKAAPAPPPARAPELAEPTQPVEAAQPAGAAALSPPALSESPPTFAAAAPSEAAPQAESQPPVARDLAPAQVREESADDAVSSQLDHITNDNPRIPHSQVPQTTHVAALAAQQVAELTAVNPAGVAEMDWARLQATVADCRACRLCERRTQAVFGVGATRADWMVVGEAPGEQEDRRGEPFVGPAGQLLDAMLQAVGVNRQAPAGDQAVYIANVLKCRPPGNRNPQPDEVAQCEAYLRRQVALVQPKLILALGRFAVQSLLNTTEPIGRLRQQVHHYQGVPVIVSYHPAYLLRNLPDKAKAWADLVLAMRVAGRLG